MAKPQDGRAGPRLLARVSTTKALVAAITADILDGTLAPGSHLREIELAEQYGVSRHSVRAGMAELVHDGLLSHHPNRGYRVPVLSENDVRDLYLLRDVMESDAIRRVTIDPTGLPAVEAAVQALENIPDEIPWNEVVEPHLAIHRALIDAVGSPRMSQAYGHLETEFRLSTVPAKMFLPIRDMASEHRQLVDLIRAGEPTAAVAFFRDHLARGLEELVTALAAGGFSQPTDDSLDRPGRASD